MSRKIIIVGAGGVGNWVAKGVGRVLNTERPSSVMVLVDGDEYETKNVDRQEFTSYGNKALVKAEELNSQLPDIYVLHDKRWVVGADAATTDSTIKATDLMSEGDIVFATVDNHAARKDIFDAATQFDNIDIFTGGNDENLFGSTYHYQRRNGSEVTEHPGKYHSEFVTPNDRNPGLLSCEERAEIVGGTQTLAANMLVGAYLVARFHKTIINDEPDLEAEIMFDASLGLSQSYDRTYEDANVLVTTA